MKNPKLFVAIMFAILAVVWTVLRTGENLGSDFEKARLKVDTDMGLNMKSNTFRFQTRPMPPPSAPKWGSFKTETPAEPAVQVPQDKNQDLLKGLAKKVTDKMKNDKKKKKQVAKNKKKKGVTLIKTAESRVNRALRRLDDGFSSKKPPVVPVAFAQIPQKGQPSPQSAAAEEPENEDQRTYEEWQDLITRRANPEETDRLIEQYNGGQLGDKRWAFSLAQEMLANDNEDVKKQGVKILDRLPSENSFAILASNGTPQAQQPEAVSVLIKKSLDSYALLQRLPILETSARSSTMEVQVQAAQSIEQSGQLNIVATPQGGRGQRGSDGTASSNAIHIRYLATVSTLEGISRRIPSPTPGKIAIDSAINSLNEMLEGGRTTRQQMLSGGPDSQLEITNQ